VELRLATFNLENLGIREGEETPEARARLTPHVQVLRDVLVRLDADAVAVQELVDPGLVEPLIQGLGYPHVALSSPRSSPLMVGVFSRFPLREVHGVATSVDLALTDEKTGMAVQVRGPFSRPALQLIWEAPGLETHLIVVHWKSKIPSPTPQRSSTPGNRWPSLGAAAAGRFLTEVKRLAQAVEIRKTIDGLFERDPRARVAVLGDFNDTLSSEGLRIVLGDAAGCDSPGLAKFELVACELAIPQDLRFTQIYRGEREMIDHILISRGLLPHFAGARALNETLQDADLAAGSGVSVGSDHAPLVATFRAGSALESGQQLEYSSGK